MRDRFPSQTMQLAQQGDDNAIRSAHPLRWIGRSSRVAAGKHAQKHQVTQETSVAVFVRRQLGDDLAITHRSVLLHERPGRFDPVFFAHHHKTVPRKRDTLSVEIWQQFPFVGWQHIPERVHPFPSGERNHAARLERSTVEQRRIGRVLEVLFWVVDPTQMIRHRIQIDPAQIRPIQKMSANVCQSILARTIGNTWSQVQRKLGRPFGAADPVVLTNRSDDRLPFRVVYSMSVNCLADPLQCFLGAKATARKSAGRLRFGPLFQTLKGELACGSFIRWLIAETHLVHERFDIRIDANAECLVVPVSFFGLRLLVKLHAIITNRRRLSQDVTPGEPTSGIACGRREELRAICVVAVEHGP